MKKTSIVPLLVACLLLAVPPGGLWKESNASPGVSPLVYHCLPSSVRPLPALVRSTAHRYAPAEPILLSFGENGLVLLLLAIIASLCAFAWQRFRKIKADTKNEKEEALLKAREVMEQEKQTALQLAYRLIREEKEMALRQARETAVQQAREIIEQVREEARMLQAKVTSTSVMLANKNDYLLQLQEKLRTTDNTDCKRIAREIKTNLGDTDHWADFINNFNLLHSHIIDKITKKHADLTPNEVKLICFVLSGMTNKEIAGVFAVEPESVKKARYRLKKKLHLKEEESLKFYLDNLE